MSHDNTAELMTDYLDDELDESQAAELQSLLASSPDVAQEVDELRAMLAVVATLPDLEAPPDFLEQVDRKLRRRRLWSGEALASGLVSMPFQVVSIIVILAVAATYMLLQLDADAVRIERDTEARPQAPGAPETPEHAPPGTPD